MSFAKIQTQSGFHAAEHAAKKRRASRQIDRRKCANAARRRRYERNPEAWLRFYGGKAMFPYPFSDGHKAIIRETIEAAKTGTGSAVAAPRGEGKTTVFRGVAVYLVVKRMVRFPVLVGWKHPDAKEALKAWLRMFTESAEFRADYPEYCQPFEHSTHATALRNLAWSDNEQITGAMLDNALKLITLPDSRGAIACRSARGDAKGLNAIMPDGTVLRPDFVLLDDAQDPNKAGSPEMVRKTIDTLENVFLGMAGPQKRLTAACACTVEHKDDVSEHWLSRPGWSSVRVSRIASWPGGGSGGAWPDDKRPERAMWDEWNRIRVERGGGPARSHYKAHKAAMTAGMAVSWPERYDRNRGDPDAFYAAMWDYYDKGPDVFSRGQQNAPINVMAAAQVRVTPDMIIRRAIGPERGKAPDGSIHIVAGADINPGLTSRLGARITWTAAAFQMHQSECVMAYGIHKLDMPKDPTPSQQVTCVYAGLNHIRVMLAGMGCEALIYDARGWYDKGVTRGQALRYATVPFPASSCAAIAAEGWPHQAYSPKHKTAIRAFEGCHMARDRVEQQTVQWIAWDADWFNLQQIRAWIAEPGAPGSCIIYSGHHDGEFLQQATTRSFMGMVEKHRGPEYDWARQPGSDDFGDCLAMCRVGAAYFGIGTGGQVEQTRTRKRYSQKDLTRG